jgi:N-dimethylarginine dimethylaminohydrolase
VEAVPLQLVDPRFYHMDTALSALPHGEVMYVPEAFTPEGRAVIHKRVNAAQRIELAMEDACQLAANTVCIGDNLVNPGCGPKLRAELEGRGYKVVSVPLGSFLRSGGAAFCLTLRLDRLSESVPQAQVSVARR